MEPPPLIPLVPQLDIDRLPLDEQENGWHLAALLHLLDTFILRFEGVLRLAEYCKERARDAGTELGNPDLLDAAFTRIEEALFWRVVAGREAAMSIYHFSCTVDSISGCIHRSPTIKTLLPPKPLRPWRKLFSQQFPHAERMRHAISHTAEMASTVETLKANASKYRRVTSRPHPAVAISMAIGSNYEGNRLTLTHKGQDVSIDMTPTTRAKLCEVAAGIYEVFRPLIAVEAEQPPSQD